MIEAAHAWNRGRDGGMREDESQGDVGQREAPAAGHLLQSIDAIERERQIRSGEIHVAKITVGPARIPGERAGETAFIKRHARDDGSAAALARGEQHIGRRLIEDVVDDLQRTTRPVSSARNTLCGSHRLTLMPKARMTPARFKSSAARCHPPSPVHESSHTCSCSRSIAAAPMFNRLVCALSIT